MHTRYSTADVKFPLSPGANGPRCRSVDRTLNEMENTLCGWRRGPLPWLGPLVTRSETLRAEDAELWFETIEHTGNSSR